MYSNLFFNTAFALAAIAFALCYFYVQYVYSYWQRHGVPYMKASFPFGNFGKIFMQKVSLSEQVDEIYRCSTEPFVGAFVVLRPTLMVRDPSLIRAILIKDFQHFVDRGVYYDEKNDPLSAHLFAIEGDKWRNLRKKLTPAFTSGKMRAIFGTLRECKQSLQNYISDAAQTGKAVEVREMSACFTTNVIASVAFGIDVDCLANPSIPFRAHGRRSFEMSLKNALRFVCFTVSPTLLKWTRLGFVDRDVQEFFINLTQQTLELREKNRIERMDFFQLLVQLRNNGDVQLNDGWQASITNSSSKTLTLNELAGQVFGFYAAGYEASASTMAFCLFEIARNSEIQQTVHEEIDRVFAQHDGELTYDLMHDLKYLECCIDETLRKYPIVPFLNRICTKDYKIPGTTVNIEKGAAILIPTFSLQRDEQFYPDPLKFDPMRFAASDKTTNDQPYLPFGDGPRSCIGMQTGKMSTKIGLASIFQQYFVDIVDHHVGDDIDFSMGSFVLTPAKGVHLKFRTRQ